MAIPAIPTYNLPYTNRFIEVTEYENGFDDEGNPVTFEYLIAQDVDGHDLDKHLVAVRQGHETPRRVSHSIFSEASVAPIAFSGFSQITRNNDLVSATNVQAAIEELSAGIGAIEWREDGAYVNGERLVSMISGDSTTFIPADINLETKVYNPEVEELKDKVANLEEEIALLKMKFMEN